MPYDWTGVEFDFVKERLRSFESLGAHSSTGRTLSTGGGSIMVPSSVVSAEMFDILGTKPLLGRTFIKGEDRPGAEPAVVLSYGIWQQEFGGDPAILGKRILLGGVNNTVIGVMPRGFYFPSPEYRVWQPLPLDPALSQYQNNGWLVLLGRARPGATAEQLHNEARAIGRALGERFTYPAAWDKTKEPFVTPLREQMLGNVKPALLLLLGAVSVLLLMACVNAAALILARTTDRTSEIVLRTALGAGRGRLARQILVESLTLSLVAGTAGALLAVGIFRTLVASLPLQNGFGDAVSMDWTTFAAAFALAMLVGLAVSAIPIRHLLLGRLSGVSGERGDSVAKGGAGRAHAVLVAAEVTLAVLLVTGATLLIRSVSRLYALDPGFDANGVVTVDVVTSPDQMNADVRRGFFRALLERAAQLPGVQSVGITNRLPVRDQGDQGPIRIEGRPDLEGQARPNSLVRFSNPDFFRTLGMDIKLGRGIEESDREGSLKVAVISESFARKMWPNQDPLGRRIYNNVTGDTSGITIVGVVEETRMFSMTGENPMVFYLPHEQVQDPGDGLVLVLRTTGDAGTVISGVRGLVRGARFTRGDLATRHHEGGGGDRARRAAATALLPDALWRPRTGARHGRGLRRGVLLGGAAPRRIRNPDGAGRRTRQRARARDRARDAAGRDRRRGRVGGLDRALATAGPLSLRDRADRPGEPCLGRSRIAGRGSPRGTGAGISGGEGQSGGSTAGRVTARDKCKLER